jgi:hypothetical protein
VTELLTRRTIKPQHDLRRLVILLPALALVCVTWHLVRPALVLALARSSLGCESRAGLVGAALHARYPQLCAMYDGWWAVVVQSWRTANSAGVFWNIRPPGQPVGPSVSYGVADETLTLRGTVMTQYLPISSVPGDWDNDGRVELVTNFAPLTTTHFRSNASVPGSAILRLGIDHNEIVAALLVDYSSLSRGSDSLQLEWRAADGKGGAELLLMRYTRAPSGTAGARMSSEVIAALDWDAPGGILRPRLLPDDGSVLVWTPKDGHPLAVAVDEPLDPLLVRLVPLPPGFGERVPATTSSPAASGPSPP